MRYTAPPLWKLMPPMTTSAINMEKWLVYDFGTYEATKTHIRDYGLSGTVYVSGTLFAGFDLGKTDYLRKAIGKRKQI